MNNRINNPAITDYIAGRISYLEKTIAQMEAFLEAAPQGSLTYKNDHGGYRRFYRRISGNLKYIPGSESETARKLALKRLYKKAVPIARQEVETLLKLGNETDRFENFIHDYLNDNPGIASLVGTGAPVKMDEAIEKRIQEWTEAPYIQSSYHPERLVHDTIRGDKVRSKSETSIADILYLAALPYRYECRCTFGNETFYPDFIIMNPVTGEIYIWEHFGLMDMQEYVQRTAHKMQSYMLAGFFPGRNLIVTYEDGTNPFTMAQASQVVEEYFGINIMTFH